MFSFNTLCLLYKQFQVKSQQFGREADIIERYNKLSRESTFQKLDRTSYMDIFAKPPVTSTEPDTASTYIPTITSSTPVAVSSSAHTDASNDKYDISKSYQNSVEERVESTPYMSPPVVCG